MIDFEKVALQMKENEAVDDLVFYCMKNGDNYAMVATNGNHQICCDVGKMIKPAIEYLCRGK